MREICSMTLSRGLRWAVCMRYVGQHFITDAGCLYARDESDNMSSRMKAACVREICRSTFPRACRLPLRKICRTILSRACRLPICAEYVGQQYLAHQGCLHAHDESYNMSSRMKAACIREICRTTFSRACRLPVCARYVGQYCLAHAGCPYVQNMSDNNISRIRAACMRAMSPTTCPRG
jgi:hypothetical protein